MGLASISRDLYIGNIKMGAVTENVANLRKKSPPLQQNASDLEQRYKVSVILPQS